MNAHAAFAKMEAKIEKNLTFPITVKNRILPKIKFLKTQCLCESDRAAKKEEVRECFLKLETEVQGTGFFDEFQKDKFTWINITSFVGIPSGFSEPESIPQPKRKLDFVEFLYRLRYGIEACKEASEMEKRLCIGVVPDLVEKLKVEWLNHSVISISYEKIELQKKGEATHGQATQSRR